MFAYAGLIRRCMLCSLFVLMDGVITMRVDCEFAYLGLIRLCMLCLVVVLMDGVIIMRVDCEWQILVFFNQAKIQAYYRM